MKIRSRHIDLIAVTLIGIILISTGVFNFQMFTQALEEQVLAQKTALSNTSRMNQARNELSRLKSIAEQKQHTLDLAVKRIPKTLDIGSILYTVHARVKEQGVKLIDFSHNKPVFVGKYKKVPVHLSLTGRFPDLYHVIHDLETLNRLFIIENIDMKQSHESPQDCNVIINASIFFDGP